MHGICNEGSDQSWYPTRLLDLAEVGSSSIVNLRLSSLDKLTGPYATLSHRWGNQSTLRLEIDLMDRFRAGINLDELPKTVLDAALATQKLGIRYLWIDTLCIIQDSLSDWQYESNQKQQVCGNAFINLSALGAEGDGEGLFFSKEPEASQPIKVGLRMYDDYAEDRDCVRPFYLFRGSFWEDALKQGSVVQNAEMFQERLLARRVLHFGRDQLLWECRGMSCCESTPGGLHHTLKRRTNFVFKDSYAGWKRGELSGSLFYKAENASVESLGELEKNIVIWEALTQTYSECALTQPTDKLVALSGVAKDMSQVFKDEYLAGTWRSHLPRALLWLVINGKRFHAPCAPSWSWASTEGVIRWQGVPPQRYVATVITVQVEAPFGKFGQVLSGSLEIESNMGQVRWQYEEDVLRVYDNRGRSKILRLDDYNQRLQGNLYCLLIAWSYGGSVVAHRPPCEPYVLYLSEVGDSFQRVACGWSNPYGEEYRIDDWIQTCGRRKVRLV